MVRIGAIGNAQSKATSYNDPTAFGWAGGEGDVYIAGKNDPGHGGWNKENLRAGDVAVLKLEAHQLSLRVQRLGEQTFTIPTEGQQDLRVWVWWYYSGNRVRLSAAEPHEEF